MPTDDGTLPFSCCERIEGWQGGRKCETKCRKRQPFSFLFSNVFILCSFTYLTDHPRSITAKTMCGRITKEEREEMKQVFDKVGEFGFVNAVFFIFYFFFKLQEDQLFMVVSFLQIWTETGTSVTMNSTSSWKAPATPWPATWSGTSSRTSTAIMTTRSALMSFCRYVNPCTES